MIFVPDNQIQIPFGGNFFACLSVPQWRQQQHCGEADGVHQSEILHAGRRRVHSICHFLQSFFCLVMWSVVGPLQMNQF